METIATLTMNPTIDVTTATERVVATDKLRCTTPRYDPGGGGINVARAIHILGGRPKAVFPTGGPTGTLLESLLDCDGIDCQAVPVGGWTRQSFTVDERRSGEQFRFVLPGAELTEQEAQRCLDRLAALDPRPDYIVASGSLPSGVSADFYAHVVRMARERGSRLIADTSGEALRQAVRERGGAYLLKPNLRELSELVGRELSDDSRRVSAARELLEQGCCEVVVLSLGAEGALLVSEEAQWHFPPISVPICSAVGVGDSMVAGIVLSLARGWPLERAVAFGMAAGAAALITPGTELCRREDAERLYEREYAQDE